MKRFTYAKAGVDLDEISKIREDIVKQLHDTFKLRKGKFGRALMEIGHYAGMIDIGDRALTVHADGVGTKVLIAQMMEKYDTIGIDCIAMNVNDIICLGSEPIALIDYLALEKPNRDIVKGIMKGLAKGAKEAQISIVGGETAIMPDVIKGIDGRGFDLVGLAIGVVDKNRVINGKDLNYGDTVIGIDSTGIHSNGLSLARKALLQRYKIDQFIPELEKSVGEELLTPTRIYVKPVLELLKRCEVHGLAHITGGAFSKLRRLLLKPKIGFLLDSMPEPLPIFKLIKKEGNITNREMYRTFNMGIGFCVCAPKSEEDRIVKIFTNYGMGARTIGNIVEKLGVIIGGINL
ncbi:MAG: phosphoribosylformylglycinamidine cyclo-ligase [archaeon]|nr:phosphoribosylformylglycinamidine cyclo-ligase [archaeon]MCP8317268.1 phosphoribosylformylglycinamidine cyclo-ligase [archaeon]